MEGLKAWMEPSAHATRTERRAGQAMRVRACEGRDGAARQAGAEDGEKRKAASGSMAQM